MCIIVYYVVAHLITSCIESSATKTFLVDKRTYLCMSACFQKNTVI